MARRIALTRAAHSDQDSEIGAYWLGKHVQEPELHCIPRAYYEREKLAVFYSNPI